ncbi:hypothetical protein AB0V92_31445, partial [Mesorhizobium ciceri]|uniref:hypothetical protein n=1 Tax=Mesorhizobium ciceri TaxID=39645 RepID=UPI00344F547F
GARRGGARGAGGGGGGGWGGGGAATLLTTRLPGGAPARRRPQRRNADMKAIGVTAALAVLPSLLKGKGGLGAILGPAVALAAYAIYRENVKSDDPDESERT